MVYTVEHHAALKRKTILIHAVKWMNYLYFFIHTYIHIYICTYIHICFETGSHFITLAA